MFLSLEKDRFIVEKNIERRAHDDASNNLPSSDDESWCSTEHSIRDDILKEVEMAGKSATSALESQAQSRSELDPYKYTEQLGNFSEILKSYVDRFLTAQKVSFTDAASQLSGAVLDYKQFCARNRLRREAVYPKSQFLNIALFSLMIIAEGVLNSSFLAVGSDAGLIGGFLMAVALSFLVVGSGFVGGHLILANALNHVSRNKKITGWVSFSALLVFVGIILTLVAHYRDALSGVSEDDLDSFIEPASVALNTWTNNPIAIQDFNSVLLLLAGFFFFFLSILKSYRYDDPYPGFGALHRKKNESFSVWLKLYSNTENSFLDAIQSASSESARLAAQADQSVVAFNTSLQESKDTITILSKDVERAYGILKSVVEFYQTENIAARSTPPPKYFGELVAEDIDVPYLPTDQISRDEKNSKLYEAELEALPNLRRKVAKDVSTAKSEIPKYLRVWALENFPDAMRIIEEDNKLV